MAVNANGGGVDAEHVGGGGGFAALDAEQAGSADGDGEQHADDAEPVATPRRALGRQPAQAPDEQHAGDEVDDDGDGGGHRR
jgi:hypothetical protein